MTYKSFLTAALCIVFSSCSREQSADSKPSVDYATSNIYLRKYVIRNATDSGIDQRAELRFLVDGLDHTADAGPVMVNGTMIPKDTFMNATFYTLMGPSTPVVFNGSYHRIQVLGGPEFPAMIDSIQSPIGETRILGPLPGTSVSRSAGFTLTWTVGGGPHGARVEVSDTGSTQDFVKEFIAADPGTLTITPADLGILTPGPIEISVARGNYRNAALAPDKRYQILIYSEQVIEADLTP